MYSKIFSKRSIVVTTTLFFMLLLFSSSGVNAQTIFSDNSVDQDSDVDSIANFGDDGSTSYSDASSFDGTNQTISEQNTGRSGFIQNGDWSNYKDIIVNQGKINSDLTNFPMLVSIFDPEVKNHAQADGDDIAFFDENGNQLPHELEIYNPNFNATHAQMVAWVKTNLTSNDDTVIRMKYGNSTMGSQQDSNNVWDNDFQAVYHLNNDPSQGVNSVTDSSKSNNDGTPSGSMVPADLVSGILGDALDFDGSNDYIDLGNSNSLQITGAITVEAWFKGSTDIAKSYLVSKSGSIGNRGWDLGFDPDVGTDGWATFRYTDSSQGAHGVGYESVSIDTWYQVVGVFNPSSYERLYLNGVLISEDTTSIPSSMYDSSVNAMMGVRALTTDYYEGLMDEVRISNTPRSSEWISAQYNNQFDPNSFYTVTQEFYYDNPWSNYKYITIDGSKITGDIKDFPVLISLYDTDLRGVAQASGGDIAFFDEFGSQLEHEIETYNPNFNATHAQLIAWVKTDLAYDTDKRITMKYGAPSLSSQENPELVWNSDYGGVWHLNDNPAGTIFDSTPNNNDGTSNAGPVLADGKIGDGTEFDDTSNQYISVPDNTSMDFQTQFTIDVWVKPRVTNIWQTIVSKMNGAQGSGSTANIDVYFYLDSSGRVNIGLASSSSNAVWATGYYTVADRWDNLVFTYNSSSSIGTLYVNGTLYSTNFYGLGFLRDNSNPFYIGYNRGWPGDVFDGVIDEVRTSNIIRSSVWIKTAFANQNDTDAFYTVTRQFTYSPEYWDYSKDLYVDNTLVSADLTDFPVLINIFDADLKSYAQADGDDIAFFDEMGAQLAHEIELYNPNYNISNAQLVAWVNADLKANSDTRIVMKYGNSTMASQQDLAGTWINGYENIWHMSGDPDSVAPQFLDSIGNNDGTADPDMTSADEVVAKIQQGTDFDNSSDMINVGQIDSNSWTALTMSAWVYKRDQGDDRVFSIAPNTDPTQSIFALLMDGTDFQTRIGTDGIGGSLSSQVRGPAYTINTWYQFVVTWDSVTEKINMYVDGVQVLSVVKDGDSIRDTTEVGLIGNAAVGYNRFFNGIIDEVRVGYTARSLEWIETEYNNQNNPGAFISVGSQVSRLVFEDVVDDPSSNVDGIADMGTHSNFYEERSKDGIYDTLTESVNSYSLISNTGYMRIGTGPTDWGTPRGTISFWVRMSSFNGRPWGQAGNFEVKTTGSNQFTVDWGSGSVVTTSSLSTNKWYFLAVTWNEYTDTLKFYIGEENSLPTVNTSTTSWTSSVIGTITLVNTFLASQGNSRIDGSGDELRYFDTDRSLEEIQSDYNKKLTGNELNLRSYFPLDNNFDDIGPDDNNGLGINSPSFDSTLLPTFITGLDLEVQFLSIPFEIVSADLAIYTGTLSSEALYVDYWNGSEWINLITNLNSSSWNNVSLSSFNYYESITIRFRDSIKISDSTEDKWQIDVVLLDYTNYWLEWEHQSQAVDTIRENYILKIYGSTTDPYEAFEIQLWNQISSQWVNLATKINTVKKWYNYTITNPDFLGTTITWRYKGDNETRDSYQGILNIDYAGIASYDEVPVPITTPIDIPNYIEGNTSYSLTWNFTDDNPNTYTIYRNGVPIVTNQPWTNVGQISLNIDGLSKGSYNFTIEVVDDNNNPTTDQADVIVIDLTDPIFDSTPLDRLYNESDTGNILVWNSTDNYPNNYIIYQNNVEVDTGSWTSVTSISYNVDGLARGDYNFTLVVYDVDSNSVTDMVWVNVTDVTAPVFVTIPPDDQYDQGATGNTITWNSTDLHEGTYTLYNNSIEVETKSWTNASDIIIDIDGLSTGLYNFTIVVYDDTGNFAVGTVWITINDISAPTFNSTPSPFPYSEEDTGKTLTWNPSDPNPDNYIIYQWDGTTNTTVESGNWLDSVDITINIDGLAKGTYNYSIYLFDQNGNNNYNSVLITVTDDTAPTLDQPPNITNYIEGTTGNSIVWNASDVYPNSLTIYQNGTFQFSTGWSSGDIVWNIDGLHIGIYNYTIVLTDDSNNESFDTVWVTVLDETPPTIDNPANIIYPDGSAGNVIEWVGTDSHPATYIVLRNGSQVVDPTTWVSQGTISINIDELAIDFYNFTIIISDSSGNNVTDTVMVEVTAESVFQSVPDDNVYYILGDTGNYLNWTVSDVDPHKYIIYQNGSEIENGNWTNEVQISRNIDGLAIGIYNFSIFVNNTIGNFITDQLIVEVSDMPIFTQIPANITNYIEGNTGYSLTWNFTDLRPDTYTIYNNSIEVETNAWDIVNNNVTLNIDGLANGLYNFTIIIYDLTGNYNTSTVWVTVLDQTAPTIDKPQSDIPGYVEGSSGNSLTWEVSDQYPNNYVIYRNLTELVGSGTWNNGVNITLSIDVLSKGVYNFTLTIYDVSGNSNTSVIWVTVFDKTPPSINSPDNITFTEGTTGPTIFWTPFDLYESNYTIYQDSQTIRSGNWNASGISLDLDLLSLAEGYYNFTVYVADQDGNTIVDTVWVNVTDDTLPIVIKPPDISNYIEGNTGYNLNWTATDLYPNNYVIYRNLTVLVGSGPWNNGVNITLNIDGLSRGTYNFTLTVYDTSGNFNISIVWVTVLDMENPTVVTPQSDIVDYIEGSVGNSVSWEVFDLHPDYYVIYRNITVLVGSGPWNNGVNITLNIEGLSRGTYNFTLTVYDTSGNFNISIVWVTVIDINNPTLTTTPPDTVQFAEGTTGNSLIWIATDIHNNTYAIYENDSIVDSGSWISGNPINYDLDSYLKGNYNISIIFYDVSGNSNTSTVLVSVTDSTPPAVNEPKPADIPNYVEGEVGHNITWIVSDVYNATYTIFQNSNPIQNGNYTSGSVIYNLDGLSIGTYNFTIELTDESGNAASDTVIVTVIETKTPNFITPPGNFTYVEGDTGNSISWNANDTYPGAYIISKNGSEVNSGTWTNGTSITISVDGLNKGFYNFSIIIKDSSLNIAGDWVIITVIDGTNPAIVDKSPDLTYEAGSTGNEIYWNATDSYPDTYIILNGAGDPIFAINSTGSWSSSGIVIFTVDGRNIGTYNFTIVFTDASGNYNSSTIWVTVDDNTDPVFINTPNDTQFSEYAPNDPILFYVVQDNNKIQLGTYRITINAIQQNGIWTSEIPFQYSLSPLNLQKGTYILAIEVWDANNNLITHSITITVFDDKNPEFLTEAQNLSYNESDVGNTLAWSMIDDYWSSLELYFNGTLNQSRSWNTNAPQQFSIDSLLAGVHNITLVIFDKDGNINTSTVMVTVFDTALPIFNSISEMDEYVEDTTGNVIIWNAFDLHPSYYEVYLDAALLDSSSWVTDTNVIINIDGYSTGTYNLTIIMYDESNNSFEERLSFTVVDKTAPVIIASQEDFIFNIDTNENFVSWTATDAHPESWSIFIDGDLIEPGIWESGVPIIYYYDLPDLGYYNFTIQIKDVSGNIVTASANIRVKDPNIADTVRPTIIIEKYMFEGDTESIEGRWLDVNGNVIDSATITVLLISESGDQDGFNTFTDLAGNYKINFNYSGLLPGKYEWRITFEKEDYQTWDDIILEVIILPHTYEMIIDILPELIQGDEYIISVQVNYDNNRANTSNYKNNLWFNQVNDKNGSAANVEVKFVVKLILENGDETTIRRVGITNENGNAFITLSGSETSNLASIESIFVEIEGSLMNIPSVENKANLPEVLPAQPSFITKLIDFVRTNIIFLPIMIAGLLGATLLLLILNRRRMDRIREINNNIKSALAEMKALNSIRSIIIQTSSKLTVFEEEVGSQGKLNINLVGGMVTAFSSFLNEIGKNEQFGYEMMEREGVSITAHKGRHSNFIVISDDKLPIVMLSQIPLVQAEIERQYKDNFTNTSRGVKKLTKGQIYPIFNKIGFKVVLRSSLAFHDGNIRKLLKQRSLSRALKQNIRLIVNFPKSEYGKKSEFYLKDLMDYFKSQGITERISSRIVILGYQFKIIEPRGVE